MACASKAMTETHCAASPSPTRTLSRTYGLPFLLVFSSPSRPSTPKNAVSIDIGGSPLWRPRGKCLVIIKGDAKGRGGHQKPTQNREQPLTASAPRAPTPRGQWFLAAGLGRGAPC